MDPLLYIDRGLGYQYRKKWGRLIFIWSILFLSLTITSLVLNLPPAYPIVFEILFLLFLSLYIANAIMKGIFLYLYKERIGSRNGSTYEALVTRENGRLHQDDIAGFVNSSYGDETLKRLGISREALEDYLSRRRFYSRIPEEKIQNKRLDLPAYILILYDNDEHFASFIRNQRVMRDDLLHAAKLVENISAYHMGQDRIFSNKPIHNLSNFEADVLNIEKAHGVYFTSPVIRRLSTLDEEEKVRILSRILSNKKKNSRKEILVSDIHPDKLGVYE